MCLIEPGPRSATVKAATDVECLATSYEEFIEAIEHHPDRAAAFMKALVRRLRQMNEMMESVGADRRGLRGMIRDLAEIRGVVRHRLRRGRPVEDAVVISAGKNTGEAGENGRGVSPALGPQRRRVAGAAALIPALRATFSRRREKGFAPSPACGRGPG